RMDFRSGEKASVGVFSAVFVAKGSGLYFFSGDPIGELIHRLISPSTRNIAAADTSFVTAAFVRSVSLSSAISDSGSPPTTATDQRPAGSCPLANTIRRPSGVQDTGTAD